MKPIIFALSLLALQGCIYVPVKVCVDMSLLKAQPENPQTAVIECK